MILVGANAPLPDLNALRRSTTMKHHASVAVTIHPKAVLTLKSSTPMRVNVAVLKLMNAHMVRFTIRSLAAVNVHH